MGWGPGASCTELEEEGAMWATCLEPGWITRLTVWMTEACDADPAWAMTEGCRLAAVTIWVWAGGSVCGVTTWAAGADAGPLGFENRAGAVIRAAAATGESWAEGMGGKVFEGLWRMGMRCVVRDDTGRDFFKSGWSTAGTLGKALGVSSSISSSMLSSPSVETTTKKVSETITELFQVKNKFKIKAFVAFSKLSLALKPFSVLFTIFRIYSF